MQPTPSSLTNFRLSLMMFLQFFVWGAFYVPLGGYLGKIFAGQNVVGHIYSTSNWAGLLAPLFVGLVADRFFNAERLNGLLHLVGAVLLWQCSRVTDSPDRLFGWLLGYFLCYMPTLALVNTITFQNVSNAAERFPKIRLWGTIGWIVAGLVVAQSVFGLLPLPVLPVTKTIPFFSRINSWRIAGVPSISRFGTLDSNLRITIAGDPFCL